MESKMMAIILIFLAVIVKSNKEPEENEQIIVNMYYENQKFRFEESKLKDENSIAYAIYNKSYERTGWDFLAISTYDKKDSKYTDSDKAYAIGYLEGYLTKNRIYSYYNNMLHLYCSKLDLTIPEQIKEFVKTNLNYMKEKSEMLKKNETYWEHVYYIYKQLLGLYDGYANNIEKGKEIDFYDFIVLPAIGDLSEVIYLFANGNQTNFENKSKEEIKRFFLLNSHCSALIKLANDYSDIWFGHNTWFSYTSMIRIFKEYRFISNKGEEKSKTIAFSSYPATLFSLDDFYYLESKLLVMETTNTIFNGTLYKKISPNALLTWVRALLSNRLASSAEEWTQIFQKENSGTYNNQYMILDVNKIDLENKTIPEKSLMIIEQIPGETQINDVTHILKEGYWPSYNVPYSKTIYEKCLYDVMIKQDQSGDMAHHFDYNECSRAKIFKKMQGDIKSSEDFKKMLRYNDYKNDELSYNDSTLTIACRYDLISNDCFGATDVKFVSVKELLEGKYFAHIISGPTNDQQTTFSWNTTECYKDAPDMYYFKDLNVEWNFDWVDYKIQLFEQKNNNDNDGNINDNTIDYKILIIAVSVGGGVLLIIAIILIIFIVKSKKSLDKLTEQVNKISFIDKDKNNQNEEKDNILE